MKKIFTTVVLLTAVLMGNNAMAQDANRGNGYGQHNNGNGGNSAWNHQRNTYYFYPYANVYYNPYNGDYWFQKKGRWMSSGRLPRNISLFNQQRVNVVYRDRDGMVWRDNFRHLQAFRFQQGNAGNHQQPPIRIDRH